MSEIPDVPNDVIERLHKVICFEGPDWNGPDGPETYRDAARAVVAHLRAHPEDAAAVLGGSLHGDTIIVADWPVSRG